MVTNNILFTNRFGYLFSVAGFITFHLRQVLVYSFLAALDSVFGGIRGYMEDGFDTTIFVSGFIVNALLAAGLAYIGDKLGVELYLAAVIVLGPYFPKFSDNTSISSEKILNNFALI